MSHRHSMQSRLLDIYWDDQRIAALFAYDCEQRARLHEETARQCVNGTEADGERRLAAEWSQRADFWRRASGAQPK